MEQNRLIRDFKGYLRKKIGIEKLEQNESLDQNRKYQASNPSATIDTFNEREDQRQTIQRELNRDREALLGREKDWLANNLKPLTRVWLGTLTVNLH